MLGSQQPLNGLQVDFGGCTAIPVRASFEVPARNVEGVQRSTEFELAASRLLGSLPPLCHVALQPLGLAEVATQGHLPHGVLQPLVATARSRIAVHGMLLSISDLSR